MGHSLNSSGMACHVCSLLGVNEINDIKCTFIRLDHLEFDSFSESESTQNSSQKELPF